MPGLSVFPAAQASSHRRAINRLKLKKAAEGLEKKSYPSYVTPKNAKSVPVDMRL